MREEIKLLTALFLFLCIFPVFKTEASNSSQISIGVSVCASTTAPCVISTPATTTPATTTSVSTTPSPGSVDSGSGVFLQISSIKPLVIKILPMLNVGGLGFSVDDSGVLLSWKNPPMKEGDFVRIIRSPKFFPLDAYDGVPVFEGKSESFFDQEKLFSENYYSIFVCGGDGVCSSGAVAFVPFLKSLIPETGETTELDSLTPPGTAEFFPEKIKKISIFQDNVEISKFNGVFYLDLSKPLRIGVESSVAQDEIKMISIKVSEKSDLWSRRVKTFLAKWNEAEKRFEISNFYLGEGEFESEIEIYDLNKNLISKKSFDITTSGEKKEEIFDIFSYITPTVIVITSISIISLLIFIFFIF